MMGVTSASKIKMKRQKWHPAFEVPEDAPECP
jgi:hypothetical protein